MHTETMTAAVEVDAKCVFGIILIPHNIHDVEVCGLKISAWVENALAGFKTAKVDIKKGDDIVGIARENAPESAKYCVVVYADTPLLKSATIEQVLSFTATYGHKIVGLPRGWVFDLDYIRTSNHEAEPVMAKNLDEVDFTIAYDYAQIALVTSYARQRINEIHMQNGVHLTDPYNTYIDAMVKIDKGTRIGPGVVLRGETEIGKNCKITNFCEVKKSKIGDGTKVSHMAYIGDAEIGKNCNIGCGVVFCNYDGKAKHQSHVGDNVFIGSNSNLVAPISVGDNAFIAAGSTITNDVPKCALALARARQAIKENWRSEE